MLLDPRNLRSKSELGCDVCIIGAGPAGISVARELARSGAHVVVLESGGLAEDTLHQDRIQQLNDGTIVGDAYAGLRATRYRAAGGTVNAWNTEVGGTAGAKYVPLDPWDLAGGRDASVPGWPFDYATLKPYYDRAQDLCRLASLSYEATHWQSSGRAAFSLPAASLLTSRIYQFGQGRVFTVDYVNEFLANQNVTLCTYSTVVELIRDSDGRVARALARITTGEGTLTVAARYFVLATGAIENARLLLTAQAEEAAPAFAGREWIGRCFMEHPRDMSLSLVPSSRDVIRAASFYDAHAAAAGAVVCGRLALTRDAAASQRLPNFSITLLPDTARPGILGRALQRIGWAADRRGYGWSADPAPWKWLSRFRLLVNMEQRPHPENRVVLANERDALGVPQAALHWKWSSEEQNEWQRTRSMIATEIEAAGLGKIEADGDPKPDPNAHHHAGTTRMSEEPRWGVVDRDGRVHGTPNLYVSGASVFPTAGYANPTLTIVALAIRLGEHLSTLLPAPSHVRDFERSAPG